MVKKVWDMVKQYLMSNPKELVPGLFCTFLRGVHVLALFLHPKIAKEYGL